MTFIPRLYDEILDDMISYVRLNTDLTDFEIGSVIRTILEAAALEDDEQYFQIVQLLDAFNIQTSVGTDLDARVADYGIVRLQPRASSGEVVFRNGGLIKTSVAVAASFGDVSIKLTDSSNFPTSGYPYTVRIGEGILTVEERLVNNNNVSTNTLTFTAGLTNNHDVGETVSYVTGAADIALSPGIRVQVPSSGTSGATVFITVASGTIVNGNYNSTPIRAKAEQPGETGNVGVGRITQFASSPPFENALVTNLSSFGGGRDLETDSQLRGRALAQIQSLTKATVLDVKSCVIGAKDPVTGQSVVTSNILESFVNSEVIVYIDDGTGFIPDKVKLAQSEVDTAVAISDATINVVDATSFPTEGWVLVSTENNAQIELLKYSSVNYATNTLNLDATAANVHDSGDEIILIDLLDDNAEPGTNFFNLSKFPIIRNSYRIWIDSGAGPRIKTDITDYLLSRGTGQLELKGAGVVSGSKVMAFYTYYTGLVATAQKIVDGDINDNVSFPGHRAAGINVVVETPTIRRITVRASITAIPGVSATALIGPVREAISAYISALGIGQDVIVAEIEHRAMSIAGMYDIVISLPTSNIVVLENELPVPFDADGTSLVTIS